MLENTFCHLSGIASGTEKKLWDAGITQWSGLTLPCPVRLSAITKGLIFSELTESVTALDGDPQYFTNKLKTNEKWRIYDHFKQETVFLDIETDGLGHDAEITTIALYDGQKIYHYINGHNLDHFLLDLARYKVIVTYSGTGFDLPVIEKFFSVKLKQAHIDLRYILASLGFKGGLKSCEKQMGLDRGDLDGVDGAFAVTLWHIYKNSGDHKALETLVAYNIADTINLEQLLVKACNLKLELTPFSTYHEMDLPQIPTPSIQVDSDYVRNLLARNC
ncbi:MAG: ribonuclease H-like domain-containing protein [Desulfotalea sp.]